MGKNKDKNNKPETNEAAEQVQEAAETAAEEINEAAQEPAKTKKKHNTKKLRFGSLSAAVVALVCAIVVVLNLMVSVLAKRTPLKLDLTPDNRYELSDETIDFLKTLDKDVEITVTTPKDTFASMAAYFKQMYASYYGMNVDMPYDMIPEILDKYSVYAEGSKGSVDVRYVDINKDPDVVNRYSGIYNGTIGEGSIVVAAGERVKVLTNDDVMGMITTSSTSTQSSITMVFAGESAITSAIRNVTDADPITAGFVKTVSGLSVYDAGYESVVTSLEDLLAKNGYDCTDIDLGTDQLSPDDYDMLVIAVPNMDFTADIIQKLGDFLYNNGAYERDLLYIPSLYSGSLPNIEEFLAGWSIEVGDKVIADETNVVQAPVATLNSLVYATTLNITDTDAVGVLPNESLPIAAPYTRELNILSKNNESTAKVILSSADTSYTAAMTEGGEGDDDHHARNAVVLSTESVAEQLNVYESHVLVFGSSFMTDSMLLNYTTTYNNASVVLNIINSMTGKEAGTVIPDKTLQQNVIAPTAGQARGIRIFVIYVIPVLIAAVGIVVLLRRRNR